MIMLNYKGEGREVKNLEKSDYLKFFDFMRYLC